MLPLENESIEVRRDAKMFFRLICKGRMSVEEARDSILISARQIEAMRADLTPMALRAIVTRRVRTWNYLVKYLSARHAERSPKNHVAPRRTKAASASS